VICSRHRRWISPAASAEQPDLTGQPDILQAHNRHLRLVRRFGRGDVAVALGIAGHICRRWVEERRYDEGFCERMRIFRGPGWKAPSADPAVAAAILPASRGARQALGLAILAIAGLPRRQGKRTLPPGSPHYCGSRLPEAMASALSRSRSTQPVASEGPPCEAPSGRLYVPRLAWPSAATPRIQNWPDSMRQARRSGHDGPDFVRRRFEAA
jgi:hypothetical protein